MIYLFGSERIWRFLAHMWMAGLIGAGEADFHLNGTLTEVLSVLSIIYVAVLAIYAGTKEFSRWNQLYKSKRHPGEISVFVWTIFMASLLIEKSIFKQGYVIPSVLISTYIAVLTIFALTMRSKSEHERSNSANNRENANNK